MKNTYDLIITGHQPALVLGLASLLAAAAEAQGLFVARREHDRTACLRIGREEVTDADVQRGQVDVIVALDPREGLRYAPYLADDGMLVTTRPQEPEVRAAMRSLSGVSWSRQVAASPRPELVLLGAAVHRLPVDRFRIEEQIRQLYPGDGLPAFRLGYRVLAIRSEEPMVRPA